MKSTRAFNLIAGRSRWPLLFVLIVCTTPEVLTQSPTPNTCPRVMVSCPSVIQPTVDFTATVLGADANQPFAYHWKISTGKIVSGQGTAVIKVLGEPPLTATVQLTGLPSACTGTIASCSILGGHHVPPVREIAEFRSIPFQQVRPRLDELAYQLRISPGSTGSIVSTRKWRFAKNAINYLSSKHGIPSERILLVDKKRKGPLLIKLFLVPPGAVPPS